MDDITVTSFKKFSGLIRRTRSYELEAKEDAKRTAAGIPTWSPTVVLICRSTAYVWQSGRDAQFS
ncbi:hypothetical protein KCU71_g17323, partial [Aureobasidium melanogenum]